MTEMEGLAVILVDWTPVLVAFAPLAVSVVADILGRFRRTRNASVVRAMSTLTAQLAAAGTGGTVTHVDRRGCRWVVTVGASTGASES
ncbi:hypothetical protein JIG36_34315 [Actinoplanes sp. LDG1-06]|uniref:Uncharacterized protein n=1 Tax=Paractinoplanes ovalisporus TaxID=2810368 RepID=A0ABS2AL67_9ACTN|nr:hypothetical protein [Actinoplanes ovalisporus]MBM2620589.1 hypothetical protein [Actinoplanes ovalisporus]